MSRVSTFRIGVDTGGTFTDFIIIRDGAIAMFKELSTPDQPDIAIMKGLGQVEQAAMKEVVHGSTVATNALLERKGARTALITTAGFEDVLEIRRQNRPSLYDLLARWPDPLVPAERRFGIAERIDHDGSVIDPLDRPGVDA